MNSKMSMDSWLFYSYLKTGVNLFRKLIIFECVLGVIPLLSSVEHYSREESADEKKMN